MVRVVISLALKSIIQLCNAWATTGALATARSDHTAQLFDGRLLVIGGYNDCCYLATTEIYNVALGRWTSANALKGSRFIHNTSRLRDGRILVSGGWRDGRTGYLASTEILTPSITPIVSKNDH